MAREPNPEAIAWYLERSEGLLDDLRERVRSLRTRGGQLAGFSGAVLALAGANVDSVLDSLTGVTRDCVDVTLLIGVLMLVAALVTALRGTPSPRLVSDLSAEEVANYATDRFIREPDLWRVHVRTIRSLVSKIEVIALESNKAARAVRKAEYLFLAGLVFGGYRPRYLDCGGRAVNFKALKKKLFRKKKKFVGPVKPNPPPWNIPLDQTEAPMHDEGDLTSV